MKTVTERNLSDLSLLSDKTTRLATLQRAFGAWKARAKDRVKDLADLRRSWDRPLPKRRQS